MSEEPTGAEWEPSVSLGDDGTVTYEVVRGESRNASVKDFAALVNKGHGFDKNAQKHSTAQKELQDRFDALEKDHEGYTNTFGGMVDRLKGLDLDEAGLNTVLERMAASIDAKADSSGDDDWFNESDTPAGMTKEQVSELMAQTLKRHDEDARDLANANATLKKAMVELNIPESLHKRIEKDALDEAYANKTKLPEAVKNSWDAHVKGMDEYRAAEAERTEAAKHASGLNISKAGHSGTSGEDPRARAPLGSPDNKAYLAERMEARASTRG